MASVTRWLPQTPVCCVMSAGFQSRLKCANGASSSMSNLCVRAISDHRLYCHLRYDFRLVQSGAGERKTMRCGEGAAHMEQQASSGRDSGEDEETTRDHISERVEHTTNDYRPKAGGSSEDHMPGRDDGLLHWVKTFVARRTAQKDELTGNLKRYGVAGILSYGILNTVYYLLTFLFVWFFVAPSPGGLGFIPAARRFANVFAMVWAGSQVTKVIRAAGALTMAPVVDKGLNWYTERFNFKSRGKAFGYLVGACVGLAAVVFLTITTLWS